MGSELESNPGPICYKLCYICLWAEHHHYNDREPSSEWLYLCGLGRCYELLKILKIWWYYLAVNQYQNKLFICDKNDIYKMNRSEVVGTSDNQNRPPQNFDKIRNKEMLEDNGMGIVHFSIHNNSKKWKSLST